MKVIVVGAGILGFNVAKRLSREDHDVVVVDVNEPELERVQEVLDVGVTRGKGSTPSVLREAGLESADMLVAVTGSDDTNIVACLLAETLHESTVRVARLRDPDFRGSSGIIDLSSLSIDLIISPEVEVAESIALLAATPGASDVLQFAGGRVVAVGVEVEAGSPMIGRPLVDLRGPEHERSLVAGIYRGERVTAPQDVVALSEGDTVFFVAAPDAVRKVFTRMGIPWIRTRHAMIFGGGRPHQGDRTRPGALRAARRGSRRGRGVAGRRPRPVAAHRRGRAARRPVRGGGRRREGERVRRLARQAARGPSGGRHGRHAGVHPVRRHHRR
jgi:trk system potassium uptake protein TrkA